MTKEKKKEEPTDIALEDVLKKVGQSFYAAACMILGTKQELYDNWLRLAAASQDGEDEIFILIEEKVTGKEIELIIPIQAAIVDEDRSYFEDMKKMAEIVKLHVKPEDIIIPKDDWPEPTLENLEEEKKN